MANPDNSKKSRTELYHVEFDKAPEIIVLGENDETDAWAYEGDLQPSLVNVDGKLQNIPKLRISKSIKARFHLQHFPPSFAKMFHTLEIGTGSKHVYVAGDFCARHADRLRFNFGFRSEHPDHVMTLIIYSNSNHTGGKLMICDQSIASDANYIAVLYPYWTEHEVTPIETGKRIAFTFPIYGTLKPEFAVTPPPQPKSIWEANRNVVSIPELSDAKFD